MSMTTHITDVWNLRGTQSERLVFGEDPTANELFLFIDHLTISPSTSPYHLADRHRKPIRLAVTVLVLYEVSSVTASICSPQLAAFLALLTIAASSGHSDNSRSQSSNLALSRLFVARRATRIVPTDEVELASDRGRVNKTRVALNDTVDKDDQEESGVSLKEIGSGAGTQQSMPPAHAHEENSGGTASNTFSILLVAILVTTGAALGAVTCLLSHHHHRQGQGGAAGGAGTPTSRPRDDAAHPSPTDTPMLSVVSAGASARMGGTERLGGRAGGGRGAAGRELAAARDRQVRLHSVRADLAVDLPPRIALPDGEERRRRAAAHARLHLRDHDQESEIYQKCIRPPPNRTVLESDSPPPYRSSSAGVLPSSSSSSTSSFSSGAGDWSAGAGAPVVRCHSMTSASKTTGGPAPGGPAPGAAHKTDFLQRTVKIFTGGKKPAQARAKPPPSV